MKKYTYLALFLCLALGCKKKKVGLREPSGRRQFSLPAMPGRQGNGHGGGEQLAAEDIQERMAALGLSPKGNAGTFYQTFTFKPKKIPIQKYSIPRRQHHHRHQRHRVSRQPGLEHHRDRCPLRPSGHGGRRLAVPGR